ncbi:MAG: hypothetical protein AB1938_24910 [Myxococcota bacterium]
MVEMAASDFELIFEALNEAGVRYLVVGGVAVVLHGHPRFTADLDLVIQLDEANARAAMNALGRLGYRPRAPVPAIQFADPVARREWVEAKGLAVFSMWSQHPATEIDVFVEEPFVFSEARARAVEADLGAVRVPVAAIRLDRDEASGRPAEGPRGRARSSGPGQGKRHMSRERTQAWTESERAQHEAWRRLTYAQRLQWLWEAKQFARRALDAAKRRRQRPSQPPPTRTD